MKATECCMQITSDIVEVFGFPSSCLFNDINNENKKVYFGKQWGGMHLTVAA